MNDRHRKQKKQVDKTPPPGEFFKFNVDGASRGKPGPAEIVDNLRDHQGHTYLVFTKSVGTKDSNEAELFSISRALTIWAV